MSLRTRLDAFLSPTAADTGIVAQAPPVAALAIARRFWPLLRPYRGRLVLGLLCLIAVPALDTLEIYLFKLVVDDVLVPRELAALLPIALAYLGLALLGGILGFFDEYLATWVGERFLLDLRAKLSGHVSRLDPDALSRRRSGDVLSRLTSDVGAIERFLLSGIGEGVSSVARILFFGVALLLLSWKLTLAALLVVPLFFFAARRFGSLVRRAAREKRRRSGSLSAVAEETLALAPLTQSLNPEDAEVERFRAESAAIMDAELGRPHPRWPAGLRHLPRTALLARALARPALPGPVRRRGRRRAGHRAARGVPDRGRRPARTGVPDARARARRAAQRHPSPPGRRAGRPHRRLAGDPAGGDRGDDGRERGGQVDARPAADPLRRPRVRDGPDRRARRARRHARVRARGGRPAAAGHAGARRERS